MNPAKGQNVLFPDFTRVIPLSRQLMGDDQRMGPFVSQKQKNGRRNGKAYDENENL
jgi:hypothetical protein